MVTVMRTLNSDWINRMKLNPTSQKMLNNCNNLYGHDYVQVEERLLELEEEVRNLKKKNDTIKRISKVFHSKWD